MPQTHLSETKFREFALDEKLIKALDECGFEYCTPIQAEVLPHTLQGKNIVGQAQTGSGKTAAFLVSTLQHLIKPPSDPKYKDGNPRSLILAPTRELALQIHKDAEQINKYTGLRLGLAFGGVDYEKQRKTLADGVDILIGTPGRIIDYFKQKVFTLNSVEVLVLDEADRMFDLGFIKDLRFIFRRLPAPQKRINLMFSATLSYRVMELAYEHMNDPQLIKTEAEQITADKVEQSVYYVANDEKIPLLIGLLKKHPEMERTIVFVNMKVDAEKLAAFLSANGVEAHTLSGDVHQRKRQRLVLEFSKGQFPVLVATDVAARGLHIPDVSHVVNFDLPQDPEDYVHRIGRTGRIGAQGHAISFACETYAFYLPEIEEYLKKKITKADLSSDLLATDLVKPVQQKKPSSGQARKKSGQRRRSGHKGKPRSGRQEGQRSNKAGNG